MSDPCSVQFVLYEGEEVVRSAVLRDHSNPGLDQAAVAFVHELAQQAGTYQFYPPRLMVDFVRERLQHFDAWIAALGDAAPAVLRSPRAHGLMLGARTSDSPLYEIVLPAAEGQELEVRFVGEF